MVSSVKDYEYVIGEDVDSSHPHGDMDRIIINGEIMPKRTGVSDTTGVERKRILRGEDICFLMEWARQRYDAIDSCDFLGATWTKNIGRWTRSSSSNYTGFSMAISARKFNWIFLTIDATKYLVTDFLWFFTLSSMKDIVVSVTAGESLALARDDYLSLVGGVVTIPSSSVPKVETGDALLASKISDFFSLCSSVDVFGVSDLSTWMYRSYGDYGEKTVKLPATKTWWWRNDSDEKTVSSVKSVVAGWEYSQYVEPDRTSNTYQEHRVFDAGTTMLTVHAPHAAKVFALCSFYAYIGSLDGLKKSKEIEAKRVIIPVQMQESSGKVFSLTSDMFAGDEGLNMLKEKAGFTTTKWIYDGDGYDYSMDSFSVRFNSIVPVVFFDDHTRIE